MSRSIRRAVAAAVAILLGCLGVAAPAWADAPTAGAGALRASITQDTSIDLSTLVSNPGGDPLTYAIPPSTLAHGTVSLTGSTVTYHPTGPIDPTTDSDQFNYEIDDGTDAPSDATVTVSFNTPPVAQDKTAEVSPKVDTEIDLSGSVSDADNDPLTYAVVTDGTHGTVTFLGASAVYHPTDNSIDPSTDTDEFSYDVSDGVDTSNVATVTIAYNTPPTAGNVGPVVVSPVHPTDIDLTDATTGDAPLTYRVVHQPSDGSSVSFADPTVPTATFTPSGTTTGSDFFTYQVSDGIDTSDIAVVAVAFNQVPTAAGAGPFTVSPVHGTPIDLASFASDPDRDPLTFSPDGQPAFGTVMFTGAKAVFHPSGPPAPTGTDSFTYHVSDGIDTSSTQLVTVKYNHVPTAADVGPLTVSPVHSTAIPLGGSVQDDDNDPLTYTAVAQPAGGSVNFNGAIATFTPTGTPTGTDAFEYLVSDGTDFATARVSLTYNKVPTAGDDGPITISPVNESTINLASKTGDLDDDPLTYSVATDPTQGVASFVGSVAHYLPAVHAAGTDSFGYQVNDGIDTSAAKTVDLEFNRLPSATDDGSAANPIKIAAKNDTPINLASFANDPDNNSLTYSVVSQPTHGLVNFSDATATFDPSGTPTGSDSFTYRVSDGIDFSNTATVTVVYNAVPQMQGQAMTVSGLRTTDFHLSGLATDGDGDPLTFSIAQQAAHGTVALIHPATARYTPATDGYFGADPFTFTVTDGFDSASATINVRVNDVPTVNGPTGTVSVPFNSPGKAITLHVSDADSGDSHTFSVVDTPLNGSVHISGSTATYLPDTGYTGSDSFSFKATDGIDDSAPVTVDLSVAHAPDRKPHASDGSATVPFDGKTSITLHGTDPDPGDTLTLTYAINTKPKHGKVSTGNTANRTYTADHGYVGSDSFTFRVRDTSGEIDKGTVTITVRKASTTVDSVVFSPAHPTSGKVVTAQVSLSTLGSARGGKVTLREGSHSHATTMSGKTATVHIGKLPAGTHTFTVHYGGTNTTTRTSATSLPVKVTKVDSSLRVTSTPKQLTTKVRGVATVHVSAPGATVDGALVTIKEGGKSLGSAVVRNGVAKITLPRFGLGQHNLAVSYAGTSSATSAAKNWVVRVALG